MHMVLSPIMLLFFLQPRRLLTTTNGFVWKSQVCWSKGVVVNNNEKNAASAEAAVVIFGACRRRSTSTTIPTTTTRPSKRGVVVDRTSNPSLSSPLFGPVHQQQRRGLVSSTKVQYSKRHLPVDIQSTIERLCGDIDIPTFLEAQARKNAPEEPPPAPPSEPPPPIRVQFGSGKSTPNQVERHEIIIKYSRRNWQRMIDLYRREYRHYGLVNLAVSLNKLARHTTLPASPHNHEMFHQMIDQTADCIDTYNINARNYGIILEALVKLKAITVGTITTNTTTEPSDGSNTSTGFDNDDDDNEQGMDAAVEAVAATPSPRAAVATTSIYQSSSRGTKKSLSRPAQVSAPGAVRILNHLSNPVFCQDFLRVKFDSHAISDVCWSLSELQRPDLLQCLLDQMDDKCLAELLTAKRERGRLNHIAKFLYACGTLRSSTPVLLAVLDAHADQLVEKGDPKAISFAAWMCGRVKHPAVPLFTAIEGRADWLVGKGNPRDLSNTAWAVAELGHGPLTPQFFRGMAGRFEWMRSRGTYQEFQAMLRAFLVTGHVLEGREHLGPYDDLETGDAVVEGAPSSGSTKARSRRKIHRPSRKNFV